MKTLRSKSGNLPTARQLLSEFFDVEGFFSDFLPNRFSNSPSVNIKETDDGFDIEVAAPGMSKSDFSVDVENGVISINASKEEESEKKQNNYTRREYNYNSFCRSFALPDAVDEEKIGATYEEGILLVKLPKKASARVKPVKKVAIN